MFLILLQTTQGGEVEHQKEREAAPDPSQLIEINKKVGRPAQPEASINYHQEEVIFLQANIHLIQQEKVLLLLANVEDQDPLHLEDLQKGVPDQDLVKDPLTGLAHNL